MSREGNNNFRIGILGFGYVGRAIHFGFSNAVNEIRIYDKDPNISRNSLEDTIINSDFIFICVPTPTNMNTGECGTSIIE